MPAYRGKLSALVPDEEVERRMSGMPASLRQALMPFQAEGVRFGLARHGRCLIADEVGLSLIHEVGLSLIHGHIPVFHEFM